MKRIALILLLLGPLAFWPGLFGPLMLDDVPNLEPIGAWLRGEVSWQDTVFYNVSGPLGRPLSMASFLLNAAITGPLAWPFKLVNLLIHFANAGLLAALLGRLFGRDPRWSGHAKTAALLAAAIWLVLPIHTATVLYVIQRMTLLSSLFSLAGLYWFVVMRERVERGVGGEILLFVGVIALTVLGALAKESGLLLPLLCLVIELAYFSPARGMKRPTAVGWFFRLVLFLPALLAAAYLASHPGQVLDGYVHRNFSLLERMYTQPRVLWDYFFAILIPNAPRLGLFHDNFPFSTGLTQPWTTLLSIFGWLVLTGLALWRRRQNPAFAAGIGLFLAGHVMESSILALEIYFLHRNYLPSIGLILAAAGLLAEVGRYAAVALPQLRRLAPLLLVMLTLTYGVTTLGRSFIWSSEASLLTQELATNPGSLRVHAEIMIMAINAKNLDLTLEQLDAAQKIAGPNEQRAVALWRLMAYCTIGSGVPIDKLRSEQHPQAHRITAYGLRALSNVVVHAVRGTCAAPLDNASLAEDIARWLNTSTQAPTEELVWKTRYLYAQLLAKDGKLRKALAEADRAFQDSNHDFDSGVLAFQLSAAIDDLAQCRKIYQELLKTPRLDKPERRKALAILAKFLADPTAG